MDPGERGRGGYNRGGRGRGRGQGYRGQGRGGHRPENERGYEELHGDPAGGSFRGQANRGGGFPQRGGRGGNRGGVGPRPRGEGYQDINTDFQHGPRGPPMHPPYGMSGPNMGPRPFDPNIRPPPNIRGPANPQQMQMNFPPNQMPPISQMQDYDEVEITYRVKPRQNPPQQVPFQQQYQQQSFNSPPPPLLGNIGPQNNNPRRNPRSQQVPLQQQYQQPNTSVPPPPLLENPGPQYSNQRAGSMMDIRNSAADNFKRHGSREQLSRGESYQNLPRSSSVQNVGGMRGRGGSRQNQHILNRGRGRGGHPQQDRSYSQDNLNQRHFNDSNQGQRERMENQNYTSENNLDDSSAGRRNIVRGQRRRRGRGYRDNNRERNTEPINDETEVNDKENEDIQRNDRRVRGRGGGRLRGRCPGRGRRGCNNNREHISDTKGSDKENESEGEDENSGERSTVSIRNNRRDRQTIRGRGRGRGGQFYPRGSFRGRFGYRGRHRPDMLVSRGRSNSESSDVSIVSTLTDTTETESVPDAASDPTRAGVLGIQSISIQTLKNRLYRYKRKLTGFKKKENPDLDEIEKLQEEINEIDTVIQRRIREEKDSKSVKSNDTEEAVEEASDESDDGTVHQHSPVQQRRLKVVGSSKKGMVSFRPKTKLKGAKASNKKPTGSVNTQRVPEEDIQSSSSDYCDLTESGDHDKKLEENSKPESAKTRRNRRRKKPDREPKTLEPTSKDVPDWQEMLEGLCSADPGIRNATNDESKGAKPKINRKQPEEEIPKIAKQHNEASQNKGTEKDLGKNDKKLNKGRKKRDQIQKEKAQQADAQTANEGIKPKCHNERTRSGSSVSDSSIDADPDEIEVFKFIVKDMKGQGSIRDIQSKCSLLNRYQGNLDEWFKRHSRKFAIFKKETKIIKVCAYVKDAEYCLDYITRRGCSKDGCHRYHICKNLLCGLCSFGEKCKFSHNTNDEHNGRIQCQQDFKNVFNNEQIIDILSLRFPHVCESWNIEGSCPDTTCCKLHICRKHVFGDCLEGDGCPFEHSLTTVQNSMITDAYHMSKWVPKLFNKIIFVLKRPPPHVISNTPDGTFAGETNEGVETQEVLYSRRQCGGIETEELTVPRPAPRPAPRKLHTRPGRKACQTDNEDDTYLKSDNLNTRYICESQLTGRCESKCCSNFHGETSGLPYIWQVKLYGSWLSLPEGQILKVEECFCSQKETSGPNIIASEDGMYQEYSIHFYPEIHAYTTHLDVGGDKIRTQARRLSTPSYAEGEWTDNSFKTQWRWSFEDDLGKFYPFDTDKLQLTLEKKYLSGQKKYLYSRQNYRFKYCLDFADMVQYNLDTRKGRKIYRRPVLVAKDDVAQRQYPPCLQRPVSLSVPLPEGWATWDLAHPFELIELDLNHSSYISAEDSFFKTLDRSVLVIDRVYRVQNPHLWKDFMSHKDTMAEKAEREGRSRDVTELLLFHGTDSLDTVRGIAINNFDHRLSGKNATMYGEGAYFAKNAKYSHAYTKPPDHFMFLARVLIGEYTKGERSYKRPPSKPGAAHELYDTCVDNISSPSIYIVFDTKQYYPEFLIQYHSIVESRVSTGKPALPIKPVISAKPAIAAKPVVAPKPSIYDQSVAYQSSPVSYPSSAVSYPTSPVSYPTGHVSYLSSAVNNPSTARRRSPSPPRTIGGHSDSGYTSYPSSTPGIPSPTPLVYPQHTSAYPGYVAARSPSPPRQATIASASTSQGDRDKDKSCVIQ